MFNGGGGRALYRKAWFVSLRNIERYRKSPVERAKNEQKYELHGREVGRQYS